MVHFDIMIPSDGNTAANKGPTTKYGNLEVCGFTEILTKIRKTVNYITEMITLSQLAYLNLFNGWSCF